MRKTLVGDPEINSLFILAVCLTMGFCILSFFYFNSMLEGINKKYLDRNYFLVGNIVERHPELEGEIVSLVLNEYDIDKSSKGKEILSKYGYTKKIKSKYNKSFNGIYKELIKSLSFYLILTPIIFILFLYLIIIKIYKRLKIFSLGIETIMNGDFETNLPVNGEGQLSMIGFQFNQMSKRLKLTMEELKDERLKLKNLISDISHQLKTPLASIKTFNDLLLDGVDEDKKIRREFLYKSGEQIDKMHWLIKNLLQLSRLESGVIKIEKKDKDLFKTVKDVIISVKVKAEKKSQNIKFHYNSENIIFKHDSKWLSEALKNIIINSIKYTTEFGEIKITIKDTKTRMKIIVKDNGIGISKKELPYIFNRFFRGDFAKDNSITGTGIGLSLSKLLIEKHQGIIDVDSKINKGTKFIITFPKSS
ncbi:MAG: HAMP domain-containing histidine kinase [Firmicutes bacterium]|nr:HAMP domain-containing histidine kinase [Bacillota bacterium]